MRKLVLLAAAVLPLLGSPASAQGAADGAPTRVVGTVETLAGDILTVSGKNGGGKQLVTLTPEAKIYGVETRRFHDIKPGDFVASGGVRGADGQIHAVEVRIFPESLRGVGDGQRPWAGRQEGVMTHATVGIVSQTEAGSTVHVTYKGGASQYTVGPEVPVLAYVLADRTLLQPGAAVVTTATKTPDGSLVASRVTAEKDGIKPPM